MASTATAARNTESASKKQEYVPKSSQGQHTDPARVASAVAELPPYSLKSRSMTVAGYGIEGVSVAGQETCIVLPQMKLAFDIGRCPQRAVYMPTVLISHAHMDHVGGLPFHVASRSMLQLSPSTVLVPPHMKEGVQQLLAVHEQMEGMPLPMQLEAVAPGGSFRLPGKSGLVVKPFQTVHALPSQGYLVCSSRRKLRPAYQGLSSDKIKRLKQAGEDITTVVETPEVAFTSDTTIDFALLPQNSDVLAAKLLIMELTFVSDDVTPQDAAARGHLHINDLAANAHLFKNQAILLIHFSARHSPSEIEAALRDRLPAELHQRCVPFLPGFLPDR